MSSLAPPSLRRERISTRRVSMEFVGIQPEGVRLSMQIEPPTVMCPVLYANLGLTTLTKGG